MKVREWFAENIGYRLFGCYYTKRQEELFNQVKRLVPTDFKKRKISDLACGDGTNTLRLKTIFEAKSIIGYERNPFLIAKARAKRIEVKEIDLNKIIPRGEMATFSFAFHHIKNQDKVKVLKQVVKNFEYVFLIEPLNDLHHLIIESGDVLSRPKWTEVFDAALGKYDLHQIGNNLVVFFKKS